MAHGYTILQMIKKYEIISQHFKKITKDIMENNTLYCGVLQLTEDLDLLFHLYNNENGPGVAVAIYRGFPKDGTVYGINDNHGTPVLYLSQVLDMFPELKTIDFKLNKFPDPY
jgi:hypothetical protein